MAPLVVLLGAFALRLYQLLEQSLWWDEAWSLQLAQQPLWAHDFGLSYPHPPLYRYLLHFWIAVAGSGEFSARYTSVLAGLLVLPLAYQLARRLYGSLAGLVAMVFLAISPAQWWYSQEVRMYIWLAVAYVALLWLHARITLGGRPVSWRLWAAWAVLECLALYTHYFAVLGLMSINLLMVIQILLYHRERLRGWVVANGLAALAFLPWLVLASGLIASYAPIDTTPPAPGIFALQTWQSYLVGAPTLVASDARLLVLGYGLAGLLVMAAGVLLWRAESRRSTIVLLWHSFVPLILADILFEIRPGFAPRYVFAFGVPWLLILAGGVALAFSRLTARTPTQPSRSTSTTVPSAAVLYATLGAGVIALFMTTSGLALHLIVTQPEYQRDNVRSLAHDLATQAAPQDVILFDYPDPAFAYYYHGAAQVIFLNVQDDDRPLLETLSHALRPGNQVFWVTWNQEDRDRRRLIPFELAKSGQLIGQNQPYPRLTLAQYRVERPANAPNLRPVHADFGTVRLVGADLPSGGASGASLPIALQWTLSGHTDKNLGVSVRLRDSRGWIVAQVDQPLVSGGPGLPTSAPASQAASTSYGGDVAIDTEGASTRPVSEWADGESAVNYYTISLPPGLPPVQYRLEVTAYTEAGQALDVRDAQGAPSGQAAMLAEIQVDRGKVGIPDLHGMQLVQTSLAPGLAVLAASVRQLVVQSGNPLWLQIVWQAQQGRLPDYDIHLRLVRQEHVIVQSSGRPAYGLYPTSRWTSGESVLDQWELQVPPDSSSGPALVQVQAGDSAWLTVGEVNVVSAMHSFAVPAMQYSYQTVFGGKFELIGYDLDTVQVHAGQPLELTLYWRARKNAAGDPPYTVFTHVLDSAGRLIAQHDGPPVAGNRPTPSWVQGEIVTDRHQLQFTNSDYRGPARLEVGLYDASTMQRLTRDNGEDRVILPISLTIQ